MARFTPDPAGMYHVLRDPSGITGQHIYKLSSQVAQQAIGQVGVDTGELRSKISYKVVSGPGGLRGIIGAYSEYALIHHEGTKPHIIKPKPGNKTLTFRSRGRIISVKIVRHPGTKPNRFLTDPLSRVVT